MTDKYIVAKSEDLLTNEDGGYTLYPDTLLDGCVVIRLQDIFAGPVLFSYANSIRTAIEIHESTGGEPDIIEGLHEIADYFMDQAERAVTWPTKKLPDL